MYICIGTGTDGLAPICVGGRRDKGRSNELQIERERPHVLQRELDGILDQRRLPLPAAHISALLRRR